MLLHLLWYDPIHIHIHKRIDSFSVNSFSMTTRLRFFYCRLTDHVNDKTKLPILIFPEGMCYHGNNPVIGGPEFLVVTDGTQGVFLVILGLPQYRLFGPTAPRKNKMKTTWLHFIYLESMTYLWLTWVVGLWLLQALASTTPLWWCSKREALRLEERYTQSPLRYLNSTWTSTLTLRHGTSSLYTSESFFFI